MNYRVTARKIFNFSVSLTALALGLSLLNLRAASEVLAQAQPAVSERSLRTLAVTGQGSQSIPATLAQIQLGVEVQGKDAATVQQEVAKRSSAVVELLKTRNVDKLQTAGIRLNPNYSYQNNVQRLIGYIGVNSVSFRIDSQRVGNLLDEAVKAGATRIDGISFTASEAAIADAQQQALRQATLDAQRQADSVLAVLNLTRREVVGIQINNAIAPPPIPRVANFSGNDTLETRLSTTPVVSGEQKVEATVTLQIRY